MDNPARSRRSRSAVLQAALAIIARDGPGRLTLEALAREAGMSKGGLMHQYRSKAAVLQALLEHQLDYFDGFHREQQAEMGDGHPETHLAADLATAREASSMPRSVAFAILAAAAEEPGMLSVIRDRAAERLAGIRAEAADPDLATLRWLAAQGLVHGMLLGVSPLAAEERERLFARLMDAEQWRRGPPP
ncbi:TetR/AcrR family transcriptional regulator [Roseomonas sp. USHLN139]|uniref:TetR/AcrR family transcriptional regulator n=1 Tax=Roseomonas sp. USHLN139 TaxID=3081298 RepID=UPI003B01528C